MNIELNKNISLDLIVSESNFRIFKYNQDHICVVKRVLMGSFCGYVGIIKGSKLYGKDYYAYDPKDNIDDAINKIEVHGGLTYCDNKLHDVDIFGDNVWWFGFDCSHAQDETLFNYRGLYSGSSFGTSYKNFEYVEENVKQLSNQLKKIETDAR